MSVSVSFDFNTLINAAATQGYSPGNCEPRIFPLSRLFSARLPA
jgi:hypothetical protein